MGKDKEAKDEAKNEPKDTAKNEAKNQPATSAPSQAPAVAPRFEIKATGDEAKNFNFVQARGNIKTTNVIESIGHLVKSCLGGGVVAIHEAYMHCGLLTAFILNIFLGLFVAYCMHILVRSAQVMYGRLQVASMSYPDLAEATLATGPFKKLKRFSRCFRPRGLFYMSESTSASESDICREETPQETQQYAVDVIIGLDLFGSCCVYAVIICRSISQLIEGFELATATTNFSIRSYLACLLIPCILICMITSLKYLAPFSIVADVFILTVAISTVYYGVKHATKSPMEFPILKSFGGLLEYIGVCVFSMEGVGVSLPIENHMKEPHKFPLVLLGGMSLVTGIVMTMGFFGYWGFGEAAKSPVTLNFPWDTFPIILKFMMALMIYVTFALNFWIPFDLVWYYLKKRHAQDRWWCWERIYRAIIVTLVILVAIAFPNVSSFMGLLGSFCLSNMGFIFPAFIQLSVQWEDPGLGYMKWRLIRFIVITSFGVWLCIFGSYLNARSMIASATK